MNDASVLICQLSALRETLPPPVNRDSCFCTEQFLVDYSSDTMTGTEEKIRATLDAISRKIEVGKVLCAVYPPEMLGRSLDGIRVASGYMVLTCAVMLHAAHQYSEPAYLNCALKMLDGLAAPQVEYPDWLHEEASILAASVVARWRR